MGGRYSKRKKPPKKVLKEKPITTIEIEEAISRYYGVRTHIIVPNLSWGLPGMHECDVFVVKQSGYVVEVEIKRSKSDLLADFKKPHGHNDNRIKEFFYALPEKLLETCEELIPEHAGIYSCYRNPWNKSSVSVKLVRKATNRKGSRKLTQEEQFKVAKLGTMRIWSLKKKLIKEQNK